jgi:hypothetical protein
MCCLFCNGQEKNYKPEPNKDFICGSCVQLLLGAEQDDLKRAHAKAIKKGYLSKARAIESFLIEDEINVRKTKKFKRNMVRKRPLRKIRHTRDKVRS